MSVDVIVPANDGRYAPYLKHTLGALADQGVDHEVTVPCVYEKGAELEPILSLCAEHEANLLLRRGKHPAYCAARARNIAIRRTYQDAVVFIDSDVVLRPGSLEAALPLLQEKCLVVFSISLMAYPPGSAVYSVRDLAEYDRECALGKFTATGFGAVMARREDVEAIRGYDERYHGPWVDDVDFVKRMELHGVRVVKSHETLGFSVMHQHHGYPAGKVPNAANPFTKRNREIFKGVTEAGANADGWGE
jgi:predicted glycosyltransferase involved in capsule biosynthesis